MLVFVKLLALPVRFFLLSQSLHVHAGKNFLYQLPPLTQLCTLHVDYLMWDAECSAAIGQFVNLKHLEVSDSMHLESTHYFLL